MAHLVAWLEVALAVARELAVGETSPPSRPRTPTGTPAGDEINEEIRLTLAGPADGRGPAAVPDRARRAARLPDGRARDALDQEQPSTRSSSWTETIDHYEAHVADLAAVLALGRPRGGVSDTLADVVEAAAGTSTARDRAAGRRGWPARVPSRQPAVRDRRSRRRLGRVPPDPDRRRGCAADARHRAVDRAAGWVTLRPAILDGHAVDRATAWFESAWRASAD